MAKRTQGSQESELSKSALGKTIAKIDPDLISSLNKQRRDQLGKAVSTAQELMVEQITTVSVQETRHSGPIPSPETLEQYGKIINDAPERILTMAEKQSSHRMELEKTAVKSQLRQSERGQLIAGAISVLLIGVGAWSAHIGQQVVSSTIFGVTIVGLVTVFAVGKSADKKSLDSKNPPQR